MPDCIKVEHRRLFRAPDAIKMDTGAVPGAVIYPSGTTDEEIKAAIAEWYGTGS